MTLVEHIKWDEGQLTTARGADDSAAINYWVHSDDPANEDREDVVNYLVANAPSTFLGMIQNKVQVTARVSDTNNASTQEAIWDAVVEYLPPQKAKQSPMTPQDGSPASKASYRLSVRSNAGETKTATYSRQRIESMEYNEPQWQWGQEPVGRLIGLELDNSSSNAGGMFTAKGVPVSVGGIEIVVEKRFENSFLIGPSFSVLADLAELAGKNVVNSDTWKGFEPGTLKFTNFECSQEGGAGASTEVNSESWTFNYTFAYSPTITAAELNDPNEGYIPPGMEGQVNWTQNKKGWHLLDVLWVDDTQSFGGFKFKMPAARRIAIQKIYEEVSFTNNLYI